MRLICTLVLTLVLSSCLPPEPSTNTIEPVVTPSPLPELPEPAVTPSPSPSVTPSPVPQPVVKPAPLPIPASSADESCNGLKLEEFPDNFAIERTIYVNPDSAGSSSDTSSKLHVVRKLEEALALVKAGDSAKILLKRGKAYELSNPLPSAKLQGKNILQPIVIGAFGEGSRPVLLTKVGLINTWTPLSNVVLEDLHLKALRLNSESPDGIRIVGAGKNLLLRRLTIEGFRFNLALDTQGFENIVLDEVQVIGSYSTDSSHSQGLYADRVKGLKILHSFFDRNGYRTRDSATIFNHNLYINVKNQCVTFDRSVSMRAGATGLQMRAGGIVSNSLFYANPVHMTYGMVNGGAVENKWLPLGVTGRIHDNVFLSSADIKPSLPRDGSVELGNIRKAEFVGNLIAHSHLPDRGAGLKLNSGMGIGIHNLLIEKNVVFDVKSVFEAYGRAFETVTVKADAAGNAEVLNAKGEVVIKAEASGIKIAPNSSVLIEDKKTVFKDNIFQRNSSSFFDFKTVQRPFNYSSIQTKVEKFSSPMRNLLDFAKVKNEDELAQKLSGDLNLRGEAMVFIREGFQKVQ